MIEPGTTRTPNDLFDVHMRELGNAELRVLLWIVRQTNGWQRPWSSSEYTTVVATMDATGLSNRAVIDAYNGLSGRGLAESRPDGKRREWRATVKQLHQSDDSIGEVSSPLQSTDGEVSSPIPPGAGEAGSPSTGEVGSLPLKKKLKNKLRKKETIAPIGAVGANGAPLPAADPVERGHSKPRRKAENPEDREGPFREVFRAICKVRRLNPDIMAIEDAANTRRLTGTLCRAGTRDAETVLGWGREWYAGMSARARVPQSKVAPPTIGQLTTAFGAHLGTDAGADDILVSPEAREAIEHGHGAASELVDRAADDAAVAWHELSRALSGQMMPATFNQWIRPARAAELDDGTLYVDVDSDRAVEVLSDVRMGAVITPVAAEHGLSVVFRYLEA